MEVCLGFFICENDWRVFFWIEFFGRGFDVILFVCMLFSCLLGRVIWEGLV